MKKILYGTSQGDNAKFNCGATDAGYKDIKVLLKNGQWTYWWTAAQYKNMMVAKKNGHIIYDILRDGGNLDKTFTITNTTEVLAKISRNMSEKWFASTQYQLERWFANEFGGSLTA